MSDATPPPDDIAGLRAEQVQRFASLMANRIGHGMSEKCMVHAEVAVDELHDALRASIRNTQNAIERGNRLQTENARLRGEAKLEVNAILHWIDSSDSDRFPDPPSDAYGMSTMEVWRLAINDLSMFLVQDIEQGRHRSAALLFSEADRG
jgi:hypothetical protein